MNRTKKGRKGKKINFKREAELMSHCPNQPCSEPWSPLTFYFPRPGFHHCTGELVHSLPVTAPDVTSLPQVHSMDDIRLILIITSEEAQCLLKVLRLPSRLMSSLHIYNLNMTIKTRTTPNSDDDDHDNGDDTRLKIFLRIHLHHSCKALGTLFGI